MKTRKKRKKTSKNDPPKFSLFFTFFGVQKSRGTRFLIFLHFSRVRKKVEVPKIIKKREKTGRRLGVNFCNSDAGFGQKKWRGLCNSARGPPKMCRLTFFSCFFDVPVHFFWLGVSFFPLLNNPVVVPRKRGKKTRFFYERGRFFHFFRHRRILYGGHTLDIAKHALGSCTDPLSELGMSFLPCLALLFSPGGSRWLWLKITRETTAQTWSE